MGKDNSNKASIMIGQLIGCPMAGIDFQTESVKGITGKRGEFQYREGETITFSIGDLNLGTARVTSKLSLIDIVPDASGAGDHRVVNLGILLQSLDHHGDLNADLNVSAETSAIVSKFAAGINFNQTPKVFVKDAEIIAMFSALNKSKVFSDTGNMGNRTLRHPTAAQAYLEAAIHPPTVSHSTCRKVVETVAGKVNGYATSNKTWTWLGIPYGKAPIDSLRWKPPQPVDPWAGIRDCTQWGNQSPQGALGPVSPGNLDEDCLNLNVVAPADAEGKNLPVMVWFHGGGFHALTANNLTYNYTALPNRGVVVVTVNHRLGPMGYLAHSELSQESEKNVSGNYGQLDLIAALNWVQQNIEAFGGDPGCVTIFGESGGGGKTFNLMISPLAKGLFHRAIIQSGVWSLDEPRGLTLAESEAKGHGVVEELGVAGETDVLAAMRAKKWQEVVVAGEKRGFNNLRMITIDGWYLTDTEEQIFLNQLHNDVPLIIGANSTDMARSMVEGVKEWSGIISAGSQSGVFSYIFDHVPTRWRNEGVVSFHGLEIPYVFGCVEKGLTGPTISSLATTGGAKQMDPGMDHLDDEISELMLDIWVQFAITGNPNSGGKVGGKVEWSPYVAEADNYLHIGERGETVQMKSGILEAYQPPPDWAPPLIPVK